MPSVHSRPVGPVNTQVGGGGVLIDKAVKRDPAMETRLQFKGKARVRIDLQKIAKQITVTSFFSRSHPLSVTIFGRFELTSPLNHHYYYYYYYYKIAVFTNTYTHNIQSYYERIERYQECIVNKRNDTKNNVTLLEAITQQVYHPMIV
jgi:hypothetical protein